ncbi:MAG TPA: nucleotidyltransferase family protein [Alphaproteobacteria bacterium]|nr:nucleotidyltransferase family protein [Alphaproteobacteria bacterium]
MPTETITDTDFIRLALENPLNRAILERLPALGLDDVWLVAGSLFETVWNARSDRPLTENIKDYDLFYYDGSDLSWEAEDARIQHMKEVFGELAEVIELKNQARVHLWYADRFGHDYPALTSSRDGIDRFLVAGTCIGLRPAPGGYELYAPYGIGDVADGILRPNPKMLQPELFKVKADNYRARWPWLTVAEA